MKLWLDEDSDNGYIYPFAGVTCNEATAIEI